MGYGVWFSSLILNLISLRRSVKYPKAGSEMGGSKANNATNAMHSLILGTLQLCMSNKARRLLHIFRGWKT